MTGLIGGRWTAGNRLELSRPNGRGRRFFIIVPLHDFRDARGTVHQGGPRQEEASSLVGGGRMTRQWTLVCSGRARG